MADGLELTPTFGIPISQIKILRAGGLEDMSKPKGNMEDNVSAALTDAQIISSGDCVICLAASGNTTYPEVIMKKAKELANNLRNNEEFYVNCSEKAKMLYEKHFSESSYIEQWKRIKQSI